MSAPGRNTENPAQDRDEEAPAIDIVLKVLRALGERARAHDKNLRPAAAAVGDIGVMISRADADALRLLMRSIAGVPKRLDVAQNESLERSPVDALTDADSHTFLAGAMWAASELVRAGLTTCKPPTTASRGHHRLASGRLR